jgi:threonine dehydrogenase-like Zn-dependent dehydrogenase
MKAVTCTNTKLEVVELPEPTPAKGQVLLEVVRTGICGSDLHARVHADEMADVAAETGYDGFMRSDQPIVFGHEFSGRVLDHGPGTRKRVSAGKTAVAMPLLKQGGAVHTTGLSAAAPGAYAEKVLVQEPLMFPVPNGLSAELAALTEPMAVGLHAVRRGQVGKGRVAVVIGCGPVGLAVIAMLKANGVRTVIASDFSAGRRALAQTCGADVVVNPAEDSPFASAKDHGHLTSAGQIFDLAVDGMDKLTRLPQWWHAYRAAEKVGATTPKSPVVFECVGVPGIIDRVIADAPLASRVVVVGVCMGADKIRPAMAINKEIDLRFVLGYTPLDFRDALHLMADGKVDAAPLVTGVVGLPGVENAFAALGDPAVHAKILIDPASTAIEPVAFPG